MSAVRCAIILSLNLELASNTGVLLISENLLCDPSVSQAIDPASPSDDSWHGSRPSTTRRRGDKGTLAVDMTGPRSNSE